jgi:hypothetical protein
LNDPNREEYARKYEADLMEHLSRMVANVDAKIKKGLVRAENPI